LLQLQLLTGPVPYALMAGGFAGLLWLAGTRRDGRWWTHWLPVALALGLAMAGLAVWFVERVWRPFPDALPGAVIRWFAEVVVAVAILGVRGWWPGKGRRTWSRLPLGISLVAATVLVLLAALTGINRYFGAYPTVGSALGAPLPRQVNIASVATSAPKTVREPPVPLESVWRAPPTMPTQGVVSQVAIPGTSSGFHARPGWVYFPPAYLTNPHPRLPVLVLLSGQPGSPRDWFDGGRLAQRMDRFAAAHHGLAPVVVIPDDLGQQLANPLCVNSVEGQAASYLGIDVPAWIHDHLQVDNSPAHWAIGGFSNGGTCAMQMALHAPKVYPTFLDISGQDEVTVGDPKATAHFAFRDNPVALSAVQPLTILAHARFNTISGRLVVGDHDTIYRPQAEKMSRALAAAGATVNLVLLPGEHNWRVWGPGLDSSLPWLAGKLGITR
jgi:S-formylglutathione hydrolase FrmB